jgi:hypothetical protein
MELTGKEPGMVFDFNDLDEVLVGRNAGNNKTVARQRFLERPIKFIPMAMALGNYRGVVRAMGAGALGEIRRICAQPHRSTDRIDAEEIA